LLNVVCLTFQNVKGELYEVDEERLELLDQLENHPRLYERSSISVRPILNTDSSESETNISEANMIAEAYFLKKFRPSLLQLPFIKSYRDGVDGKKYVTPKDRKYSSNFWYEVHTGYEQTE